MNDFDSNDVAGPLRIAQMAWVRKRRNAIHKARNDVGHAHDVSECHTAAACTPHCANSSTPVVLGIPVS